MMDAGGMDQPHDHAMAVRYQQRSAEIKALQRQCYLLATLRLEAAVEAAGGSGAGLAIVSDIDETILDNSAVMAHAMNRHPEQTSFDIWKLWEREGQPHLIPGAADFLELADRLGVTIFYVSDRSNENKLATIATLSQLGLPQADAEHVLLLGPPKVERRTAIGDSHNIILLLGDTLHDFDDCFAGSPLDDQHRLTEHHAKRFGDDWIIFPNAAHGTWMEADIQPWKSPV